MPGYTAKQITELLQREGADIHLRTVRYYTQIGMVPPLETVENKRVYTDNHLAHFRAILTLSKTGETLASIRKKLQALSMDEIKKIGKQMTLYQSENLITRETTKINDDAFITLSSNVPEQMKQEIVDSVSRIMKKNGER
ncbi:MerR family transcriptional regulator [Sporolactobacillus sp. CQH2019]|uniref:MerR family transcriptional regulator n=1 Tax=Sporolactobacillus sp. CQH2019 TaxID=3023512 RepID=UPI0023680CCF|nr:MerR family transcriptional regulator [Sporolactobacillus sp. CQH2019]MDD9149069.1 MerR family transcriptional regulator [Sporolactobacillus sp. CQH2019]